MATPRVRLVGIREKADLPRVLPMLREAGVQVTERPVVQVSDKVHAEGVYLCQRGGAKAVVVLTSRDVMLTNESYRLSAEDRQKLSGKYLEVLAAVGPEDDFFRRLFLGRRDRKLVAEIVKLLEPIGTERLD